jgi:sarcosine oxidase subunit beta
VVIGAGVLGLTTAYFLCREGAKVVVLDKGMAGGEASGRATGFLSLRGEQPLERPIANAAESIWSTLDEELGSPTEWCPGGRLWVATDPDRWAEMVDFCPEWERAGIGARLVDGAEARRIAPCLGESAIGAVHTLRGGHANPQRTCQAFAWAIQRLGATLCEFVPATGITVSGGQVAAVETPMGSIATRSVVACGGPQLGLLGRMVGLNIPIAAARVEAMVTEPLAPLFGVCLVGGGVEVRQTRRGNLHLNGGPHEWVDVALTTEPAKPNTPIIRNIARRLAEFCPALANVRVLRSWSGIIDVTPDQCAIVDRDGPDGFFFATASGHGFGFSPGVGRALADLVLTGESSIDIRGLGLDRFAGLATDWRAANGWQAGAYNT